MYFKSFYFYSFLTIIYFYFFTTYDNTLHIDTYIQFHYTISLLYFTILIYFIFTTLSLQDIDYNKHINLINILRIYIKSIKFKI